jgi:hypothetical protein
MHQISFALLRLLILGRRYALPAKVFCPLPLAHRLLPGVVASSAEMFGAVRVLFGQRVHGLCDLVLGGGDHLGQPDGFCLDLIRTACHLILLPRVLPFMRARAG